MFDIVRGIQKFYTDYKDFIDNLISGGLPAILLAAIAFFWWLKTAVPLQERLLDALERYEQFSGKVEVRVIATARNEKQSDFVGEASPWDKLQWEKYPRLWQRFKIYELPEPEDDAIIGALAASVTEAKIQANPQQYPELARRNDATFRNVVENLRRLKNDDLPLNQYGSVKVLIPPSPPLKSNTVQLRF